MAQKIVFLNALVTSSRLPLTLRTRPISIDEARTLVGGKEITSFIGHEATAKLLSSILAVDIPVNRGMYDPRAGDIAIVVRLKKRLEKPEDVKTVTPSDIEFIYVEYSEYQL